MKNIQNKIDTIYPKLSKTQQKVADYLYYSSDEVVFYTATKLSTLIGVSDTTIIRFCMLLGYKGYSDFQNEIKETIKNEMDMYSKFSKIEDIKDKESLYAKSFTNDMKNIENTLKNEKNTHTFKKITESVIESKNVYILGSRNSTYFVGQLEYRLNFTSINAIAIPLGSTSSLEKLINITPDDCVIVFVFPRYSKITTRAIKFLSEKNIPINIITDNSLKFSEFSNTIFNISISSSSYMNSYIACLAFCNALVSEVALRTKLSTKNSLEQLEKLLDYFDVF